MLPPPAANVQAQSQLETLYACLAACERCVTASIHETDGPMKAHCIALCRDCADVCALTARLVARSSDHVAALMAVCVAICHACAEECARHPERHCQECAEACRRCA